MEINEKHESLIKEAKALNSAFVEAFISYFVYDKRRWMIEDLNQKSINPVLEAIQQAHATPEQLTNRKVFEMYTSLFNKKKFEPVSLSMAKEGKYNSSRYGYETDFTSDIGDYTALNNLARACIARSKNLDGTYTLHVSYRGTDTDARKFKTFVTDAYLDMSAYYDAFKPLEKAVLEYAQNPENKISNMKISGHSLGGAMVPEFFKSPEVKACSIPMEGITFGAPGNKKKKLYSFLPAAYHSIKHGKFLEIGRALLDNFDVKPILLNKEEIDTRITQYAHVGDLIPRVAALVYEKEGTQIVLEDVASKNASENYILTGKALPVWAQKKPKKKENVDNKEFVYYKSDILSKGKDFIHKAFTFQFHDMLRYIMNVEHKTNKILHGLEARQNPELKAALTEALPDIVEFGKYRQRFERVASQSTAMGDVITSHLLQKAKESGKFGGTLPHNTQISERIASFKQKNMANKFIKDVENDFNSPKFKI